MPKTLGREPKRSERGISGVARPHIATKAQPPPPCRYWTSWGEDFTVIDEMCCGSVLQRVGVDEETVKGVMEKNVQIHRRV